MGISGVAGSHVCEVLRHLRSERVGGAYEQGKGVLGGREGAITHDIIRAHAGKHELT